MFDMRGCLKQLDVGVRTKVSYHFNLRIRFWFQKRDKLMKNYVKRFKSVRYWQLLLRRTPEQHVTGHLDFHE
jgi:hypothetical protein